MRSILRIGPSAALAAFALGNIPGCYGDPLDEPATVGESLKFGAAADPVQTGVPVVWHIAKPPSFPGVFIPKSIGTAVLLNDRWALSSKHVFDGLEQDKIELALGNPHAATTQMHAVDNTAPFVEMDHFVA